MSGMIGSVSSKSGCIHSELGAARPRRLIHQGTFTFQYGGSSWTCNYTIPSFTGSHREFWLKINWGDYRWDSECFVRAAGTYFGTGGNLYNHWNTIVVSTGGVVTCNNGNGGSSGNLTAELRVWMMESEEYTSYNTVAA